MQNFNTAKAPRMTTVFPQAMIADKFIFLSGTTGILTPARLSVMILKNKPANVW
jgi:hypothetical protein